MISFKVLIWAVIGAKEVDMGSHEWVVMGSESAKLTDLYYFSKACSNCHYYYYCHYQYQYIMHNFVKVLQLQEMTSNTIFYHVPGIDIKQENSLKDS